MTDGFGIYIHIPFCACKCNYCSFYSLPLGDDVKKQYCNRLINDIKTRGGEINRPVSSIYIGGGTPTVMGGKMLFDILNEVKHSFNVIDNAEITVEANPADNLQDTLARLFAGGCNRLSFGVQSVNSEELTILGRRHGVRQVKNAIQVARKIGFNNISLDLMIGLPNSTTATLKNSIDFIISQNPNQISAYILKVEDGTPLCSMPVVKNIPNDDLIADQYLFMCESLENAGYTHYEISNFAKSGFEGKHNINYWKCGEYLGFGPSAHSFYGGERFFYTADLQEYLNGSVPVFDGVGGTAGEYIMLGLRLDSGISNNEFKRRFGKDLPKSIYKDAELLQKNGLCLSDGNKIKLTDKGMLVSNSIITLLTEDKDI